MSNLPPNDPRPQLKLLSVGTLTIAHLAIYCVAATWAYGGQADWVRQPLTVWGSLGFLITLAAVLKERGKLTPLLYWMVPIALFDCLVLIGASNPCFREMPFEGDLLLALTGARDNWPTSARPLQTRTALWEFNAIWFSCLNLCLVVRRRRAIRILLVVLSANALVLAVFGTVQKLLGYKALFFGTVPSPQLYFFSTFVYPNHWGAFMLLSIAATLALTWHYAYRHSERGFLQSPGFSGLVCVFLLGATIPLSGSRSSSVLAILLLGGAALHWLFRQIRHRRQFNESIIPPLVGVGLALTAGAAGAWSIGSRTIAARAAQTVQQIEVAKTAPGQNDRLRLYRDTWRMAAARPWFGWGMASYPYVFMTYNTRVSVDPIFYKDAHSDLLQSLAEHGAIGTTLLAAAIALPLLGLFRRKIPTLATYLFSGCGMLLAYSLVEFPFGNYAVVLSWWTCFFAAVTYARLSAQTVPHRGPEANP
jgi:O-antigen ligase